jgi:hypothetical protein
MLWQHSTEVHPAAGFPPIGYCGLPKSILPSMADMLAAVGGWFARPRWLMQDATRPV